ncbi:vacuolar-sorting receptor [Musa troglodytarum]|uniref:Vacuolar-sorting receptor n=1 Tax=Musa troglodytarum TaxID=320322 RepID=A0A9E7L2N1_9LILI|nr:vacuolar-sorting receptor [Musa troglodytarum]
MSRELAEGFSEVRGARRERSELAEEAHRNSPRLIEKSRSLLGVRRMDSEGSSKDRRKFAGKLVGRSLDFSDFGPTGLGIGLVWAEFKAQPGVLDLSGGGTAKVQLPRRWYHQTERWYHPMSESDWRWYRQNSIDPGWDGFWLQESGDGKCQCPLGFEGDGVKVCENINECKKKTACQCPECSCKDTWGSYECTCSGDLLYIKEQDTCISEIPSYFVHGIISGKKSSEAKATWAAAWVLLMVLAIASFGAYVIYKYRLRDKRWRHMFIIYTMRASSLASKSSGSKSNGHYVEPLIGCKH